MDAFAASFNLRVDIGLLDEEAAERAAQLTERTNQHNACKCALARLSALALATARARMSSSILRALGTVSPCAPAMHRAHCTEQRACSHLSPPGVTTLQGGDEHELRHGW